MDPIDDTTAWEQYPNYRTWFNKLWLSEKLGYQCGPAGVCVPQKGHYIVRPIYNLMGMGLDARVMYLDPDFTECQVPAGHFWCEMFEGPQYSADFQWSHLRDGLWGWKQLYCWRGYNNPHLWRFYKWEKVDYEMVLPWFFNSLGWDWTIPHINVESIDSKIIEIHLRQSPDPYGDHTVLIPLWEGDDPKPYAKSEFTYIPAFDNCDGQLPKARLGFFVR